MMRLVVFKSKVYPTECQLNYTGSYKMLDQNSHFSDRSHSQVPHLPHFERICQKCRYKLKKFLKKIHETILNILMSRYSNYTIVKN